MSGYYAPEDLLRNKQLRPLSKETLAQIETIKDEGDVLMSVFASLPQSAEMTLAKRKLEESVMWAVKAVTA